MCKINYLLVVLSVVIVAASSETLEAICKFNGPKITGEVVLTQDAKGETAMKAVVKLAGFDGAGLHGYHIHEGTEADATCSLVGGHYYPDGVKVGDMTTLESDQDGKVDQEMVNHLANLADKQYNVIGRTMVVHAQKDGGTKLGCCKIELQ